MFYYRNFQNFILWLAGFYTEEVKNRENDLREIYSFNFASSLRKLCFREKNQDISVRVLEIV